MPRPLSTVPFLLGVGISIASPSLLPAAAPVQTPGDFDTSGVALFWEMAERLAAGEAVGDSAWDAYFQHPGYAVTERSGQRKPVIRHCMAAAFSPEGDLDHARTNPPAGEGRAGLVQRLCDHMGSIRAQRSEIESYVADLDGHELLADGLGNAAGYLPVGTVERVPTPVAYVLLFEQQGFGRDGVIVLDGLVMMMQPREQTVEFIAHELHHAYRAVIAEVDPEPDAASLVHALDGIVREGSASMLDKAPYVRTGRIPHGYPSSFLDLVAETPERLANIDQALSGLEPTPDGYEAAARVVRSNSPWGGHLNGTYMGMAIEDVFGPAAVIDALVSPVRFFRAYQQAAESLGGDHFRFSGQAMAAILALPEAR